jgi:SNF2 family DNA or RNA helicase
LAAAGTLKQNYANILLMLLRLRQACDHPLLVKGNQSEYGGDGSIEMAKQLPKQVVIDLLAKVEVGSAICTLCSVSNLISHHYTDVYLFWVQSYKFCVLVNESRPQNID